MRNGSLSTPPHPQAQSAAEWRGGYGGTQHAAALRNMVPMPGDSERAETAPQPLLKHPLVYVNDES